MVKTAVGILSRRGQDDNPESSHTQKDGWEEFPMDNQQKYRTQTLINQWEAKARTAQQSRVSQMENWYEPREFVNQGTRIGGNQVQENINLLEKKKRDQARETRNEENIGWRSAAERSRGTLQKVTCKAPGGKIGSTQGKSKEERESEHKDTVPKENNEEDRNTLEKKGGVG